MVPIYMLSFNVLFLFPPSPFVYIHKYANEFIKYEKPVLLIFNYFIKREGKREGQLLYPNRVAVVKHTGDIVVTERSPTHQIQIYNQYGNFLRKFGANILQHPRGVCVDSKGRIIVVECKVSLFLFWFLRSLFFLFSIL